jgi:alcohol dehydrogenase
VLEFFQYHLPTRIVGGQAGFLTEMAPELLPYEGCRAGLITDDVMMKLGILEKIKPCLEEAGIKMERIYHHVPPDSDVELVEEIAADFAKAGCDLLIAIGGGSVIDTAKAVNILLSHGGQLRDYQGAQIITQPLFPLIVVPTTVGTGSEVTNVAVIVDRQEQRKLTFLDHSLAPTLAVLDPMVTYTLPAHLTASTAIDALTHALEAYIDLEHNPFSDAMAVSAVRLIRSNLHQALQKEEYQEARAHLQIASTMAGIAFNHSMVGIVHAMGHALGSVSGVPHGVANSLMLVEGLRCNLEAAADRIALIGVETGWVTPKSSTEETAISLIHEVDSFLEQIAQASGLPRTLKKAGVKETDLPLLVQRATEDGSLVYNPKPVEADEIETMFRNVMGV